MARAKLLGIERPTVCPQGHAKAVIWLRGTYVGKTTQFERTRFTCARWEGANGDRRKVTHNFTALFSPRRPQHDHTDDPDFECEVCERDFKRGEGARTPFGNLYAIREQASILVHIGEGNSYSRASLRAHQELGRISTEGRYAGGFSEYSNLAIDTLDAYGGVIDEAIRPRHWPHTVVLDSMSFRFEKSPEQRAEERATRAAFAFPEVQARLDEIDERYEGTQRSVGSIFAAVGYELDSQRGIPWLIRFSGSEDEDSWEEFLRSIPGPGPRRVVADRHKAIANAVARVWPESQMFHCEWHLRTNAEERLWSEQIVRKEYKELDPLWVALAKCFRGRERWEILKAIARDRQAVALLAWIDENEELVLRQAELRDGVTVTNGAVERLIDTAVKNALSGRAHLFGNRRRLDRMLALVRANEARQATTAHYSQILRRHLRAQGGRSLVDWEAVEDKGGPSIRLAMREAIARHKRLARERNRIRLAPEKASRHRRMREDYERRREELGLPPSPRGRPRQPQLTSVAGLMVSDVAWLAAEWHPTLNEEIDPREVPAGSNKLFWWKCAYGADHEWEARPNPRARHGQGCPFCTHRITPRSESLGVTHPDIAAEWHPTRNRYKTPYDYTWGSHFEAWWVCSAGFKSHDYQARIASRTSTLSACPKCARKRGFGGRPKRSRKKNPQLPPRTAPKQILTPQELTEIGF